MDTEQTMTDAIPDTYAVTSGFLQAGVMTASAEPAASASPSGGKKKSKKGKGRRNTSSTSAQASGSSYQLVSVPAEKEMSKVY